MTIGTIARNVGRTLSDNAPTILTGVGIAGIVSSGVLFTQAGIRLGAAALGQIMMEDTEVPDFRRVLKDNWHTLVLPTVVAGLSITAFLASNRISTNRQIALAAAYSILETRSIDYAEGVKKVLGPKKDEEVRAEVAKEAYGRKDRPELIIEESGDVLCYDAYSDREWISSKQKIRSAMNDVNEQCVNSFGCSLNEFYRLVDLGQIEYGEEVGWNTEVRCDVRFSTFLNDRDQPVMAIEFRTQPIRRYDKVWG